jgi:chemotaxis methyl-accepting protein methylase
MLDHEQFLARSIGKIGRTARQNVTRGLQERPFARSIGRLIHTLSRKFSDRNQSHMTWFMRYPPLLLTISDLINDYKPGESLRICVIGCSTGAEIYSLLWTIRQTRADLKTLAIGVDLSEKVIGRAKAGLYSREDPELKRLSGEAYSQLFDLTEPGLRIKESIAANIEWRVGDVRDDECRAKLGPQHIVLANNFLIHMREAEAEACLTKIAQLVAPGGLLICRGVDLDVRERVVQQLGLWPISKRIEEIHEVAVDARRGWPWKYWGLEPLDKTRKDWARRYATIFQVPCPSDEPAVMSLP